MSSSLASEPAYYFPGQLHNQTPSSEELGGSSVSSHSFEWKEGNSWQGLFRNGLPTPPTSKAMTGLTLKNHYNTGVHPPAQSLSKYSHQDAVSGGNSTVERNLGDRGREQLGYTDRSQRHRVSSSRDFGFDTKKSSGNIIASNFRIPESVNNSGGSIAEFAAEVRSQDRTVWENTNTMHRLLACSGLRQPPHCDMLRKYQMCPWLKGASFLTQRLRSDSANGSLPFSQRLWYPRMSYFSPYCSSIG